MDAYTHSLTQARAAKEPVAIDVEDDGVVEEASRWFCRPETGYTKTISYRSFVEHADRDYLAWRTPSARIDHVHTMETSLDEWVRDVSVEDLARIIRTTPRGLSADPVTGVSFDFAPWQRISMAFYVRPFFPTTSRVTIDTATLRELADYAPEELARARRLPISAELSTLEGTMRDFGIVDLPTAAGKTAWVLSVALMTLSGDHYDALVREFLAKLSGTMFKGPSTPRIARLAIVAAAGTTFNHFVTTLTRLVPRFAEVDASVRVVVWCTMSKHHSTRAAFEMPPDVVVVWIVPPAKLNGVLREHPDITVPLCIVDEYTQDTPRERYVSDRSTVMKRMIAQATPQALQRATMGSHSDLKEIFGGFLVAPQHIHRLVRRREFKDATFAVQQLCKLDQMTLTPFRERVRNDLRSLVPNGMFITFVRSRRVTMASHILDAQTDLVPISLTHVILKYLDPFRPDAASQERIRATVTDHSMAPTDITTLLDGVTSVVPNAERSVVDRLKTRITEFTSSCPICMNEDASGIHIMGCCGYCMCDGCFHAHRSRRCAFCRTEMRTHIPRSESADEATAADPLVLDPYPPASTSVFDPPQMRRNTQVANLTHTLHHVRAIGCTRVLIIVERPSLHRDDLTLDVPRLSSRTGIAITRVDDLIRGKGTQFAKVKAEFDAPDPRPMALICYGIDERFLVGTDLAHADCVVTVGSLQTSASDSILTQALFRVLRPRRERDNTQPLRLFKIYTGSYHYS